LKLLDGPEKFTFRYANETKHKYDVNQSVGASGETRRYVTVLNNVMTALISGPRAVG